MLVFQTSISEIIWFEKCKNLKKWAITIKNKTMAKNIDFLENLSLNFQPKNNEKGSKIYVHSSTDRLQDSEKKVIS